MSLLTSSRATGLREAVRSVAWPQVYEGLYYAYLAYRMFAVILGLDIENLGAIWLAGLAVLALPRSLTERRRYAPIILVGLTSAVFVGMQLWVHHLSLNTLYVTIILVWPLNMLVIEKCSHQPGFLKRLAVAMFILLVAAWPTATYMLTDAGVHRASLQGTPIDNPNDLAAWIGFSALIFWLWGLQQTSLGRRVALWAGSLVSFWFMAQTVSRTALAALALAGLLSLRRFSLRFWVSSAVAVALLAGVGALFPPLRQLMVDYADRMDNGSERFQIWPLTLQAIAERPLTGYGTERIGVFIESRDRDYTPHNGVIFFGMAAGVVPMLSFVVLWLAAAYSAVRLGRADPPGELDVLPLFAYGLLFMLFFNFYFTMVWAVAALCYCFPRVPARASADA